MQKIISIKDGITRMPEWRMKEPVNFEAIDGEHIAIVGNNGSGKSMLADIITGSHPLLGNSIAYDFYPNQSLLVSENIKYITFRDSYGENNNTYFLQQRWNQQEIDEDTPTVRQLLDNAYRLCGEDTAERRSLKYRIFELFGMDYIMDKYIILLSSGELRKFQIAKALFSIPRVFIIHNPFIGLDAETRTLMAQLLKSLTREIPLQIIIVLSKTNEIPEFITHVVEVTDMVVNSKMTKEEFVGHRIPNDMEGLDPDKKRAIKELEDKTEDYKAEEVVAMNNVCITYGTRKILDSLNWTVMNGERWALNGRNGSGKSTLLSLICADNPQSYACDINMFERKRGTGESIWDIKKHIGYVSPEMHRAYMKNLPAIRIVASGMKDSVGLYAKPSDKDYATCRWWMNIFGLDGLEEKPFLKLSSGEQRLVLLARAFVKDPELLILDEPLHGLDDRNRRLVKDIICAFCERKNKTLIMVTHYEEELPACINRHLTLKHNVHN